MAEKTGDTSSAEPYKIWHDAACHCHAVEYRIFFPPLYPPYGADGQEGEAPVILNCNCSICLKNGYYLIYPLREEVQWLKGWETLRDYEFATKSKDHKFCPKCGSSLLIDFRGKGRNGPVFGMNARMIKNFDPSKVQLKFDNGRDELHPEFNEETA